MGGCPGTVHGKHSLQQRGLFVSKLNYDRPKRGDIVIIQIYEGNWDYLAFFKDIPLFRTLFPARAR